MNKFLLLFALPCLLAPVAASAYDQLSVHLTDGSKVDVTLSDDMTITFTPEELVAKSADVDVAVSRSEISHFTHVTPTGISDVVGAAPEFTFAGNTLSFTDLPEGSSVAVYNLSGMTLLQAAAQGSYTLSLEGFAPGAYIVTVNNISYKIAVK